MLYCPSNDSLCYRIHVDMSRWSKSITYVLGAHRPVSPGFFEKLHDAVHEIIPYRSNRQELLCQKSNVPLSLFHDLVYKMEFAERRRQKLREELSAVHRKIVNTRDADTLITVWSTLCASVRVGGLTPKINAEVWPRYDSPYAVLPHMKALADVIMSDLKSLRMEFMVTAEYGFYDRFLRLKSFTDTAHRLALFKVMVDILSAGAPAPAAALAVLCSERVEPHEIEG